MRADDHQSGVAPGGERHAQPGHGFGDRRKAAAAAMVVGRLRVGLIVEVQRRRPGRLQLAHRAVHVFGIAKAGPGIDHERRIHRAHDGGGHRHRVAHGHERLPLAEVQAERVAAEIERLEAGARHNARRVGIEHARRGECLSVSQQRTQARAGAVHGISRSNVARQAFVPPEASGTRSSVRPSLTAPST